ncbi:7-methyl-GTP pyrophosphatase-like isoform X1 [Salvia splendens]|uniref:7-methyl-GTP pyrophosphatase-like isoform X1 n=1 Tax=Salvia splendens TaxID=180675 RepID=UPI001C268B48|nr:7-methyl-GTP pyrophosphatase-like isoform X1 [Salvia splendens]
MDSTANNQEFKIILGSSSVARKKIMADMGFKFTTMSADIDEKAIRKEKTEDLVMALAEAKADAIIGKLENLGNEEKDSKPTVVISADTVENVQPKLHGKDEAEPTLLITCDQVVVYEGMIREKPSSKEEARQFIKGYSGGHAATVSSVLVTNLSNGSRKGGWDKVEIHFHDIPEEVIEKLIEEALVLNVAGGLIIEHPLVAPYVKEVVGGTDSVMGLPKDLTRRLMKEVL